MNKLFSRGLLLAGVILWCAGSALAQVTAPIHTSLIQLIAHPKEFDGKRVQIVGFVRLEFEGNAIYLHRDDELHGILKNGLWLNVEKLSKSDRLQFDGRYAFVEGTFSMEDQGHLGLWSGALRDITRMEPRRSSPLPPGPVPGERR
ncbi:hypothetical protein [Roseateles sp. L2-2]|uniref:hypothetical protein n=1 Tax=Roseateles TaxID=93681 RepID=UPI003D359E97